MFEGETYRLGVQQITGAASDRPLPSIMQKRILITATAMLLSLPLASHAADDTKKKGPFVAADTDGDGKISQTEYIAAVKDRMDEAAAKAKFAELDKNSDKSLSREEFAAGAGEKKGGKKKKDAN
jgi:hypothetical protein